MIGVLKKKWKNDQKGSALVMMACSLAVLMFTGGVVVDLGSYYSQISNLQNAADAAAAAGSSVYVKKGNTRLIPVSNDIDKDGNFTYNMDGQDFAFRLTDTDKNDADALAEHYVTQNQESTAKSNMETRLWEDKVTSTLANGSTVSRVAAYAYRVDLTKPVELYFSKLFGLDGFDAKASAMAVFVVEPDEDNIEEFVEEISANIYNTIPNYYWEGIHASKSQAISVYTPASETVDGIAKTEKKHGFGSGNAEYFTTDFGTYISQKFVDIQPLDDKSTIAYAYSDQSLSQKWCADPIKGTDKVGLTKMVYNLNKKMIQQTAKDSTGKYTEITGLFLDRPNLNHNSNGIQGKKVRATELNISGDEISSDNTTPLYMRFESEPVKMGSCTFAQPIIINVNGIQKKPLVIAYDGPDANRTKNDAPWVNKSSGDARDSYGNGCDTPTASITPPPYIVNLNTDFNGVIYAPFSKITITGSGKIVGFIMAKEIEDSTSKPQTRKAVTANDVVLPTWGRQNGNNYSYKVKNIKGSYSLVYDEFYNYTKIASKL